MHEAYARRAARERRGRSWNVRAPRTLGGGYECPMRTLTADQADVLVTRIAAAADRELQRLSPTAQPAEVTQRIAWAAAREILAASFARRAEDRGDDSANG